MVLRGGESDDRVGGAETSASAGRNEPRYYKPKILLVDMPSICTDVLRDGGYNVTVGTFGEPYWVSPSNGVASVPPTAGSLRQYEEQEIIICNMLPSIVSDYRAHVEPGPGVESIWQSRQQGIIDPRPLAMASARRSLDRIQEYGGLFIVFLAPKCEVKYLFGTVSEYGAFKRSSARNVSDWSFLSDLCWFDVTRCGGTEITWEDSAGGLASLLRKGAGGAHYQCSLKVDYRERGNWRTLARNKYGDVVAGRLVRESPKGGLLLLPQMPEVHRVLVELLETWCAEWNPALFPHLEGAGWVHRTEYENSDVVQLQKEVERVRHEANESIKHLEVRIEELREQNRPMYTLLRGTGKELVEAVIHALHKLGFRKIVDVDAEGKGAEQTRMLREDVQIHDREPVLVIDVKGIRGCPDDAESTQAEKHALMRIHEWGKTRVQPLTIINHQRHLPPQERDPRAYRDEIVANAAVTGLGLMTTWDLWRILRNKRALGWPCEAVRAIFYRVGRIEPVPEHYREVGKIVHVWKSAFGIVPSQTLRPGVNLAVEIGHLFTELTADSLHVDGQSVDEALAGSNCGVAYEGASEVFREGMPVFLVST